MLSHPAATRRCLLVTGLLLCGLTPNAVAATTFPGYAAAGPAIAGDTVIWAENEDDGGGVLKRDGQEIYRYAAAKGEILSRSIAALDASPTRIAFSLGDRQRVDDAAQTQTTATFLHPWTSMDGVNFTEVPDCVADGAGVAVDGNSIAFALDGRGTNCYGIYLNGALRGNATRPSMVRLAGNFIAWIDNASNNTYGNIVVANATNGYPLATFRGSRTAAWDTFDIDAKGNIVAVREGVLYAFSVKKKQRRVLSRKASAYAATAGGRVVYISTERKKLRSLNVIDLKGKLIKRLDRFSSTRTLAGQLSLTDHRVAWAVSSGSVLTDTL